MSQSPSARRGAGELPRPLSIVKRWEQRNPRHESTSEYNFDALYTNSPLLTQTQQTTLPRQFASESPPSASLHVPRTRPRQPFATHPPLGEQCHRGLYSSASEIITSGAAYTGDLYDAKIDNAARTGPVLATKSSAVAQSLCFDTEHYVPHVLVPKIRVTPELETVVNGETSIWVAVEVEACLQRPDGLEAATQEAIWKEWGSQFEIARSPFSPVSFGCLYNLVVDVFPVGGAIILEILQEETFPVALSLNTAVLLLVHLQLSPLLPQVRSYSNASAPLPPRSDILLRDLEAQLGASPQDYLRLRLGYCHSAFAPSDGESELDLSTKIETMVVASIRRRDPGCLWARDGSIGRMAAAEGCGFGAESRREEGTGVLVRIAMKHWGWNGVTRAVEAMVRCRDSIKKGGNGSESKRVIRKGHYPEDSLERSGSPGVGTKAVGRKHGGRTKENTPTGNVMPFSVPTRQTSLRSLSGKHGQLHSQFSQQQIPQQARQPRRQHRKHQQQQRQHQHHHQQQKNQKRYQHQQEQKQWKRRQGGEGEEEELRPVSASPGDGVGCRVSPNIQSQNKRDTTRWSWSWW